MYHDAMTRKAYPSDVSDETWALVTPFLMLMDDAAPWQNYPLSDVANGLRSLVRKGAPWRMLPTDPPLRYVLSLQLQCWMKAGGAQMVYDIRMLLCEMTDCTPQPRAVIVDKWTLPAPPARGERTGDDGHNRRNGATVHMAVATLGYMPAVMVTPANDHDRARVATLAYRMQGVPDDTVDVAFVSQGDTGE